MDNFQLYSTNVLLGGQIKWDLILGSSYNGLFIDDFNISPISDNIAFDYKLNKEIINYPHQDNIRNFYKKIESSFFSNALDDKFYTNYPIVNNKSLSVQYSDKYIMGAKRSLPFSKYNKEIEFLCPIWLEYLNGDLSFIIKINSIVNGNKNNIASKSLVFNKNDKKFHNRFVNYFNNYIDHIGLNTGDDKVLNINFEKNTCNISGISLESGNNINCNIDSLIENITDRERPMMEVDNMIIETFKNNKVITKQLFNFNLCFNLADIMSNTLFNLLLGNKLNIEVIVKIGDEELLLKDFYTNYEYIPRKYISRSEDKAYNDTRNTNSFKKSINIFNYLEDNKCIDLIDKNKFSPNICHWSLSTNSKYIFNVYSGFGSYYENYSDKNGSSIISDVKIINSRYLDSPDLKQRPYNITSHNIGWCNHDLNLTLDKYKLLLQNRQLLLSSSSVFTTGGWTNNVFYKELLNEEQLSLNVYICQCPMNIYTILFNTGIQKINTTTMLSIPWENCLIFITTDPNSITFKSIIDLLDTMYIDEMGNYIIYGNILGNRSQNNDKLTGKQYYDYLLKLKKILNQVTYPSIININKSLYKKVVDGPSTSCKEIEYYKNDNANVYIYRYDGSIKPTFIDQYDDSFYNYLYEKKIFNDKKIDKDLLKSEYEFIYPSIQHCFYKVSKTNYNKYNSKLIEYKWYNNGFILCLEPNISIDIDMDYDSDIMEIIRSNLKKIYINITDIKLNYIVSLYDYSITYDHTYDDYSNMSNIDTLITKMHCKIKLTLK